MRPVHPFDLLVKWFLCWWITPFALAGGRTGMLWF